MHNQTTELQATTRELQGAKKEIAALEKARRELESKTVEMDKEQDSVRHIKKVSEQGGKLKKRRRRGETGERSKRSIATIITREQERRTDEEPRCQYLDLFCVSLFPLLCPSPLALPRLRFTSLSFWR